MCGISGIISVGRDPRQMEQATRRMVSALRHRGPDMDGVLSFSTPRAQVCFGHTRLSIIDLSDSGRQPMEAPDGSAIVFNGEVYNFGALRKQLVTEGTVFKSRSDTEVVLRHLEKYSRAGLPDLRGMFALAFASPSTGRVLLARDELGIKPLYYYHSPADNILLFASEVRALLSSGLVPREVSREGLRSILAFGSAMQPWTIINRVLSLPAGHYLEVEDPGGALQPQKFLPSERDWQVTEPNGKAAEAEDEFIDALSRSVSLHLISDARLGCFLSGGMDSPTIALLSNKARAGSPLETFCLGVEAREFDESEDASEIARALKTEHHNVRIGSDDLRGSFDSVLEAVDQPSWDGANTFYICREASNVGLKVMLSGLGGDEALAGYDFFHPNAWRRLADAALERLPAISPRVPAAGGGQLSYKAMRLSDLLRTPQGPARWLLSTQWIPSELRRQLLREPLAEGGGEPPVPAQLIAELNGIPASRDKTNTIAKYFIATRMRMTFLADTDAMSMAHSLEVRVPFVDREVLRSAFAMHGRDKTGGERKQSLRRIFREAGQHAVLTHKAKRGFHIPFGVWMRREPKLPVVERFLAGGWQQGGLFSRRAKTLVEEFCAGRSDLPWSIPYLLVVIADYCARHALSGEKLC
jgi:asparagine synthase (glutamine-hydrolysing)